MSYQNGNTHNTHNMKNTTSTHTTDYLKSVREVIESKPADLQQAIIELARTYGSDENRFVRQEIIEGLIGIKHQLVKCGIGMLAAFTNTYLANLKAETVAEAIAETTEVPAQEEAPAGIITKSDEVGAPEPVAITKPTVGLKVIRKQCKRQGEVTAIEGQHVTVTLADGSVRKPCASRFLKLYIQA